METLRSTGITPLLRYYGLLRFPAMQSKDGYGFPPAPRGTTPTRRASQVPRSLSRHAPSPFTPENRTTALACVFIVRSGFTLSGGLAALILVFRGRTGFAYRYGSHRTLRGASIQWLPTCTARLATCPTGISHGELLSVHKRDQAWPDAPETAEGFRRII